MVLRTHELLEESPGVAGNIEQKLPVLSGELVLSLRNRPAQRVSDERRRRPKGEERGCGQKGFGAREHDRSSESSFAGFAGFREVQATVATKATPTNVPRIHLSFRTKL